MGRDWITGMRIAVIGAGAAGLAAARALKDVGLTPTVFEATSDIGGLWLYRAPERGGGPAYRSLRTNTSKQITAFSDLPFRDDLYDFPSRASVEGYLREYAAGANLLPLIRFGCRLQTIEPLDAGCWRLSITENSGESTEIVDAALICTGIFHKPVLPAIPGLDSFSGRVLHSVDYRTPERFAGQQVLVVGLGSSAADIATDLLGTACVTLSTRRGARIVPRTLAGRPLDHRLTRLALRLPARLRERDRERLVRQEYERRGIGDPLDLWTRANVPFLPGSAPSVTSDDLLSHLIKGEIGLRPGIERIEGNSVVFADGSCLRPDTIIFCTGYDLDFPFLPPDLQPWRDAERGLYRLVFPPEHPTLPFIGVCRVQGPIFPIVEMQSRWVAAVLTGTSRLPAIDEMRREIWARWERQLSRRDSPIRVALIPYLDELAGLIGARPRLWKHPRLLRHLLTGPPVAAQYRLDGPGRRTDAAGVIARGRRPA